MAKYKAYDTSRKAGESTQAYYNRLATVADKRLQRLEELSKKENYATANKWAYARAAQDIKKWGDSSDKPRFRRNVPKSETDLLSRINDIKAFLEKPTSTKSGITEVYQKRADTLNKKYGADFSWQDLANYYRSGEAAKYDARYGSDTAYKILAAIKDTDEKIVQKIYRARGNSITVTSSDEDAEIREALADTGLLPENLTKKGVKIDSVEIIKELTGANTIVAKNALDMIKDKKLKDVVR